MFMTRSLNLTPDNRTTWQTHIHRHTDTAWRQAAAKTTHPWLVVCRDGPISPWYQPISIRYKYFWPKISAISISISFTAALFSLGLLIIFHYRHAAKSSMTSMLILNSRFGHSNVTSCIFTFTQLSVFKLTLKVRKKCVKISKNYRYFTYYVCLLL